MRPRRGVDGHARSLFETKDELLPFVFWGSAPSSRRNGAPLCFGYLREAWGFLLFERLAWPIKYSILWARKSNSLAAGVVCIELDQTGQSLGFDYGVPLLFG
jgi:hypothetical protein